MTRQRRPEKAESRARPSGPGQKQFICSRMDVLREHVIFLSMFLQILILQTHKLLN